MIIAAVLVSLASNAAAQRAGISPHERARAIAYGDCVKRSARQFARSRETATVVGRSAIQNCDTERSVLMNGMTDLSAERRRGVMAIIDERMQRIAELEVVRARSR